jgi:hypothetical protein
MNSASSSKSGFRLVFPGGVNSRNLPADQLRMAVSRIFKLSADQYAQLCADQILTLDPSIDEAGALNCIALLEKLGLAVALDQAKPEAPPASDAWLSKSGFTCGFTQTDLNIDRAAELLNSYANETSTKLPAHPGGTGYAGN